MESHQISLLQGIHKNLLLPLLNRQLCHLFDQYSLLSVQELKFQQRNPTCFVHNI
jgi:hypothetical protein